jgi:hypothetical protein
MGLVDRTTVEALQLRVPGLCLEDAEFLGGLMSKGILFPRFKDQQKLHNIWSNVLKVRCLIPTIWSLFQNVKYWMTPVKIMKQIFGKDFEGTISEAMADNFSGVNQNEEEVRVQETESTYRCYRGNKTDRVRLGTIQLWLFIARNFIDMSGDCLLKENGQKTPMPKTPDPLVWHAFAVLAYNLGFECDEINRLREPPRSKNDETAFESYQSRMEGRFGLAKEGPPPSDKLDFFVDGSGESLKRRCGRTFENAYTSDRQYLFLRAFYVSGHVGGRGITSLFVRVSVFLSFFGRPVPCGADAPTLSLSVLGPPLGPAKAVFPLQHVQISTSSARLAQDVRLEEEIDCLRSELLKAREDRCKMRQEIQEMQELMDQSAHMDQTVRRLEAGASDLRDRQVDHENVQREVERLRDDQVRARREFSEYKDSVEMRIQEREREIDNLRSQHEANLEALQSARSENEKVSAARAELELNLKELELTQSEISEQLRIENGKLSIRNGELQQRLESSETTRSDALKEALIERQRFLDNNEQLHEQIQLLLAKNDELKQKLKSSEKTQSDTLEESLSEKQELLANKEDLQKQIWELLAAKEEVQRSFEKSEITHSNTLKEVLIKKEKLFISNEGLHEQNQQLLAKIKELEQNLKVSKSIQSDALEECLIEKRELFIITEELGMQNEKLLMRNGKLQQDLENSKTTQSDVLRDTLSEREKLLSNNEELYNQNQQLLTKNGELQQRVGKVEQAQLEEREELGKQLISSEEELADTRHKAQTVIVDLRGRIKDLEGKVDKLETENSKAQNLVTSKSQDLSQAQGTLAATQAYTEALRADVTRLKVELERQSANLGESETARQSLKEQVAHLKVSLSESLQKMESIKESADAELEKGLEVEKTHRVTQQQLVQAAEEREHARKQLETKEVEYRMLQELENSLTSEVRFLKGELAKLHQSARPPIIHHDQQACLVSATVPCHFANVNTRLDQGKAGRQNLWPT